MDRTRGFGLVEIIMGAAIISMVTAGAGFAIHYYIKTGLAQTERVQAAYLLEEGLEAARYMRDQSWTSFATTATGTAFSIATSSAGWATTTNTILVDGTFTRTVRFDDVWRRNSDQDIVPATSGDPKTKDANARKVTVTVSWTGMGSTTASTTATTYLTNIFNN